jgi:rhomboid protease GluP
MPQKQQSIPLNSLDAETTLLISYQAFKDLGWTIQFADDDKLSGQTIKKWNSYPQQVTVVVVDDELFITSEMIHDELADISGKNQKNIDAFIAAFNKVKNTPGADNDTAALNELRATTKVAVEQEIKDAIEVEEAMNLSKSNLFLTYGIIAINIIVFILMAINGAGIFEPNGLVHIKWGSNYGAYTLSGDWWRLLSNLFLHFGLIHLAMNMYCLYMVGMYLEPMLGKTRFIIAYLCTGVLASLASLWWFKTGANSAGASGAIFGMYGMFLALLTTSLIPKKVRNALLQSIGIFVVFNLFYGLKGGIDNAAHIGGLLSGFVFGYLYAFGIKKERTGSKAVWQVPVLVAVTVLVAFSYLNSNKQPASIRTATQNEIDAAGYADNKKFAAVMEEVYKMDTQAIGPMLDTTLTDAELKEKLLNTSRPKWEQFKAKLLAAKNYDVSPAMKLKTDKLLEYVDLRNKEINILVQMVDGGDSETLIRELNEVRNGLNRLGEEISGM